MSRILIVDDDASFGARAVKTLQDAGFQARFHHGPFGSLHAIRETASEVVLLDVNMPKLDGAQLVRMIQQAFGARRPSVLLWSNMHPRPLQRIAAVIGAQGAIVKDAPDAELITHVTAALAARNERKAARTRRYPAA